MNITDGKVEMSKKDFLKEHRELVKKMAKKGLRREAREQAKEIKKVEK